MQPYIPLIPSTNPIIAPNVDLWNESFNQQLENSGKFDIFKKLPKAESNGQSEPPLHSFNESERVWRVKIEDPKLHEWINMDLHVKGFSKPLSLDSYRIRAFKWDNPDKQFRADSKVSPEDAYNKLCQKKLFV